MKSAFKTAKYWRLFTVAICFTAIHGFGAVAGDLHLHSGLVFEYNFYGQPGFVVAAAHNKLFGAHPQIRLQYTTSKLSFWNGPYAVDVHDVYGNVSWRFRPGTCIDPYAGFDVGTTWYDREDNDLFSRLDNSAIRCNFRAGVSFSLWQKRVQLFTEGGYTVLQSSTTYPLFFACGATYAIMNGGR